METKLFKTARKIGCRDSEAFLRLPVKNHRIINKKYRKMYEDGELVPASEAEKKRIEEVDKGKDFQKNLEKK